MSIWYRVYHIFLNLSLKLLVKSKIISNNPCSKIYLNIKKPILYVIPYNSTVDLLTIRTQCLQHNLPDPLIPIQINNISLPRYIFIHDNIFELSWYNKKLQSITLFHNYLNLHSSNSSLDIQIIPVLVMFGRDPGKELQNNQSILKLRLLNYIEKFFIILWLGRDSFVYFLRPFSMRNIYVKYGSDRSIAKKLARVLHINFIRQRLIVTGPRVLVRQNLFKKLLSSRAIEKAIEDETFNKKISIKKAQQNAIELIEEIATKFSYEAIRLSDRILGWTWSRIYQKLNVHNIDQVRQLAIEGHEIVYIPCHRSHIDYLLLSYVLYHQGLMPPYIIAGINLNFWPAGPIFRRLGAFFIRRVFKSNKFYSIIFREYLSELFARGYSIEYFIEGSRSRTGRLLKPKTGILTMTIQSMLRSDCRPITLVPIYIGYEHVIEIESYNEELSGNLKKKDGIWQIIRSLYKLHNLGQSYINFGDPLPLASWLSQKVPEWHNSINSTENQQRPYWLASAVNEIATTVMVSINNATAVNAINLCSSILLVSHQYSITRKQLLLQLNCYLNLLHNVPYTSNITVPNLTSEELLIHALEMNKLSIKSNINTDDVIFLSYKQVALVNYYRNNIQHLLVLPSLVAGIIYNCSGTNIKQLKQYITSIYPLLKAELFIHYNKQQLLATIDCIIIELIRQDLIKKRKSLLYDTQSHSCVLQLLAACINGTLQRYAIIFSLLRNNNSYFNKKQLEKESQKVAQQLSILHGINVLEFFDKTVFYTLMNTLRIETYINNNGNIVEKKINDIWNILIKLIAPDMLKTIESISISISRSFILSTVDK